MKDSSVLTRCLNERCKYACQFFAYCHIASMDLVTESSWCVFVFFLCTRSSGSKAGQVWAPEGSTAFKCLISARFCAALLSNISDCDETFNYWEPVRGLLSLEILGNL